jgi:hypothetical protein
MLVTSESRNVGDACSLSDILEDDPDPGYSLSAKACMGILDRAERRGRTLPEGLREALVLTVRRHDTEPIKGSSGGKMRSRGTPLPDEEIREGTSSPIQESSER